jgi:hypothetical protein
MNFFGDLSRRNRTLYLLGWLNFIGALVCVILIQVTDIKVLGINSFIKPMKFFVSIWIFCWTMGWYTVYLHQQKKVKLYNRVVVLVMLFEMTVIVWQAANGRLSHFNISTLLYASLFKLMGIFISVFAGWTLYIGILFFKQKEFSISDTYLTGIRMGIIFFVLFSFEGGVMAARLSHSIGGPDGGSGLPLINWSNQYGDLRVAHFFGIHALQVLPIIGLYLAKTRMQMIIIGALYFLAVSALLLEAFLAMPLMG